MKRLPILLFILCISSTLIGQAPQAFKYQAAARNAAGELLVNQTVSFRISILKGSESGQVVYTEALSALTNLFGLVNLEIGRGTVLYGTFSTISWGIDNYFLKVEMDPTGGSNYQVMGVSQLLSVPYALYSNASPSTSPWNVSGDTVAYPGYVKIGSLPAYARLSVSDNTNGFIGEFSNKNPVQGPQIFLANDQDTYLGLGLNGSQSAYSPGNAYLWLFNNHDLRIGTNNIERMRIRGNGRIGIGTASPLYPLDVNGTVRVTGFRLPTGAQDGYILTSEADGNAIWKQPPDTGIIEITTPPEGGLSSTETQPGVIDLGINEAGVTENKLAPQSVSNDKILDQTILFNKIGNNAATPGQVMKWNGTTWEAADDYGVQGPITSIFAVDGLFGGGYQGSVVLGLADQGVTGPKIAPASITGDKIQTQTIQFGNIGPNGASPGQVMKWDGSIWKPGNDSASAFQPGGSITGNMAGAIMNVTNTFAGGGNQSSYAIQARSSHNLINDKYHFAVYALTGAGANPYCDPFMANAAVFGGATEAGKPYMHGVIGTSFNGNGIYGYSVEGNAGYFNGPVKVDGGLVVLSSIISQGGSVGVGTGAPSSQLDLEGSSTTNGIDINNVSDADGDPLIHFQLSHNSKFTIGVDDSDHDKLKIGTTSLTNNNRLTIDSIGQVGLGTETPYAKLHVMGNIRMQDGNEGDGKVLTSDVNGEGSWEELPNYIGGSGTQHYLAKFAQTDELTGSILYEGTYTKVNNLAKSDVDKETSAKDMEGDPKETGIGIGTTTPKNKLDIEGSAAIGATYSGNSSAPSNGLIVEGNVGLGTTSPLNKLDIFGAAAIGSGYAATWTAPANGLLVEGKTGIGQSDPEGMLVVENKLDTTSFRVNDEGTDSSPFIIDKNGNVGIGTETPGSKLEVDGTIEVNQKIQAHDGGGLEFATSEGTSRLFLNHLGYVGIGTSSPSNSFEIESAYSADGITIDNTATDGDPHLQFALSGTTKYTLGVDDSDGDKFKIGTSYTSTSTFLTIDASGNVGIHETSPTAKMHVEQTADADAFLVEDKSTDDTPFVIKSDGKVGIGTTVPTQALEVSGTIKATSYTGDGSALTGIGTGTGGVINTGSTTIGADSDANGSGEIALQTRGITRMTVTNDGIVECDVIRLIGGGDIAEPFNTTDSAVIKPGMVLSIDRQNPGNLMVSGVPYDKCVAGIVSGAGDIDPGLILSKPGTLADGTYPVALSGRVYCLADASFGPIEPGDMLTSSSIPGYAMKVMNFNKALGAVIGKAMTPLKEGKGLVLVLVSLQ